MGKYKNEYLFKSGKMRGTLTQYKHGIIGTIWKPFEPEDEIDGAGLCFDFDKKDLPDVKSLICEMDSAGSDKIIIYEYDEEDEEQDRRLAKQQTTWFRFKWWLKDWGIQFMPFDWEFKFSPKRKSFYTLKNCFFAIGPLKFTKGSWRVS